MKALLLSNSTMPGEPFLGWSLPHITKFLGSAPKSIAFIPNAVVTLNLDDYAATVSKLFAKSAHKIKSVHNHPDPATLIATADAIMVSGGNSFQLLKSLYALNLVEAIRKAVKQGTLYVGWSAGSNVACPTISTTNDMPIAQPPSFEALRLVPFQINPHYTEKTIEGHGGESRDQRLKEFLTINPKATVVAMREGCGIQIFGDVITVIGTGGSIMRYGTENLDLAANTSSL